MSSAIVDNLASLDCREISTTMEIAGMYCAEGAVPPAELAVLRSAVLALIEKHGRRYFSLLNSSDSVEAFANIVKDPRFVRIYRSLAQLALNTDNVRNSGAHDVLRVAIGAETLEEHTFQCHFDASVVTILVPIFIPEGEPEEAGDFVYIPNKRPFRRSTLVNLIEKGLHQSARAEALFGKRALRRHPSLRVTKLVPGNVYFFWGYRTYHANFPVARGELRATLLVHHGDPHLNSLVTRAILALQTSRQERVLRGG